MFRPGGWRACRPLLGWLTLGWAACGFVMLLWSGGRLLGGLGYRRSRLMVGRAAVEGGPVNWAGGPRCAAAGVGRLRRRAPLPSLRSPPVAGRCDHSLVPHPGGRARPEAVVAESGGPVTDRALEPSDDDGTHGRRRGRRAGKQTRLDITL